MGNCIGRKNHEQQPWISILDQPDLISRRSILSKQSLQSHSTNHYDKQEEGRISGSLDTSLSPSFSSLSSHSSSFSSDDQLILPSSSSSSFSDQIYLTSTSQPIFTTFSTSLSHVIDPLLHRNIISHHCSILRSVIDDVIQQRSIRIHRQTTRILLEYLPFHCIQFR